MRKFALVLSIALLAAPVAAQEREGDTISFELQQNVIFVEGTINGEGPFTFLFDTGASVTLLRRQTAERLGLDVQRPDSGGGSDLLQRLLEGIGMSPGLAMLDSIALGDAAIRDLDVAVMNVPQAELPLTMMGISYDGIIGYNFISQFETTINYRDRTIRLEPVDYDPGPAIPELEGLLNREPRTQEDRPPRPQPAPRTDSRAWIGFTYRTVGDDEANEIGVDGGVVVSFVAEGSPAASAGLQEGDVILEIDDQAIRNADGYREVIRGVRVGQELQLRVLRERQERDMTLTVGSR